MAGREAGRKAVRLGALGIGWVSTAYCALRYGASIGKCESTSMEPAIHDGDWVIISPIPVNWTGLQKGDVLFCRSPRDPEVIICKRLVGLDKEFVFNQTSQKREFVKLGHVWLEGDDRQSSIDSRTYGPVAYGLLWSKVLFRIWPLSRIGRISLPEDPFSSRGNS